jgi:hypothetical protein
MSATTAHPVKRCQSHASPIDSLRFAFLLFLIQSVLAQQPTPIVSDPKLTPGDAFDVAVQDLCVLDAQQKVRNVRLCLPPTLI